MINNQLVLQTTEKLPQASEIWILIGLFLYTGIIFTISAGLCWLTSFHARLMYVGLTTVGYNDLRRARGPELWSINTKEFRKQAEEAKQFEVNYHELNQ
jgi:hypothetical protein